MSAQYTLSEIFTENNILPPKRATSTSYGTTFIIFTDLHFLLNFDKCNKTFMRAQNAANGAIGGLYCTRRPKSESHPHVRPLLFVLCVALFRLISASESDERHQPWWLSVFVAVDLRARPHHLVRRLPRHSAPHRFASLPSQVLRSRSQHQGGLTNPSQAGQ